MPIYEYRCDDCGHDFETIQRFSDDPLKTCPACGKEALRKRMSASAFRLKGGGWYETDFKAGNKRNVAGDDKGGKESGKAAADGATESKGDSGSKKSSGESGSSGGESKSSDSKSSDSKGGDSKSGPSSKPKESK